MLAVGARAPEFTLPDQDGRDTSLTSLLNHGPLVLFFYPADFTPGCTTARKTVEFPLQPGDYVLQVSANAEPALALMIIKRP